MYTSFAMRFIPRCEPDIKTAKEKGGNPLKFGEKCLADDVERRLWKRGT